MRTNEENRATLTIEEAAERLGISRTLAYELASRGHLPVPVLRLGRRIVVSRLALERVLGAATAAPVETTDGAA